jgi:hypothetical protein
MRMLKAPPRVKKQIKKAGDKARRKERLNKEAGERMEAAGQLPPPPKTIRRPPAAPDPAIESGEENT